MKILQKLWRGDRFNIFPANKDAVSVAPTNNLVTIWRRKIDNLEPFKSEIDFLKPHHPPNWMRKTPDLEKNA